MQAAASSAQSSSQGCDAVRVRYTYLVRLTVHELAAHHGVAGTQQAARWVLWDRHGRRCCLPRRLGQCKVALRDSTWASLGVGQVRGASAQGGRQVLGVQRRAVAWHGGCSCRDVGRSCHGSHRIGCSSCCQRRHHVLRGGKGCVARGAKVRPLQRCGKAER